MVYSKYVASIQDSSLILLTYKGKILLMTREEINSNISNPWVLIGGVRNKSEKLDQTILRIVEKETGLKLDGVTPVFEYNGEGGRKVLYHASLTDKSVNNIHRIEGHLLNFFSLQEALKLPLSPLTHTFAASDDKSDADDRFFDIPAFLRQKS